MIRRLISLGLLVAAATAPVAAHQAPSGWEYDRWCCSNNDCAPIAAEYVRMTPGGWRVDIPAGGHPMVKEVGTTRLFKDHQVKFAPDGQYHACVVTDEFGTGDSAFVRCLYVPMPGV